MSVTDTNMPESVKQPLPSGPSSLCFDKEEFKRLDFNVETFIVECRRRVQLETLRDDLALYLKILQSAMIELINKDYADFVNLSTNLVGMDKAISGLISPLEQLKEEIMNVQGVLDSAIAAVEVKMNHQAQIRQKKVCLQRLMNIMQSVESMEKLLGIPPPMSSSSSRAEAASSIPAEHRSGQLIERVATEFNKLQFYVSKSHNLPLVDKIKPRIANITSTLQYSLEGHFLEGLETGNTDILRQCLRIYATIDKMRNAENLFRKHVVAPFMEEIISEDFLQNHPHNLRGLYAAVLDFIPQHCKKLQDVTTGSDAGGEVVRGYDFLVNAVWPEIVTNIETHLTSIFAPGNPNKFHQKYRISMEFVDGFERQCGSQASVKRLRAHPALNTFMSKWSLPVYFQIRFQEIAGTFEGALTTPFLELPDGSSSIGLTLHCSQVLWESLHQCWQSDIYLSPLCHRFWKLTLQLISRYTTWVAYVQTQVKNSEEPEMNPEGNTGVTSIGATGRGAASTGAPGAETSSQRQNGSSTDGDLQVTIASAVSSTQLVYLVSDVEILTAQFLQHACRRRTDVAVMLFGCVQLPEMCRKTIIPQSKALGLHRTDLLEESVEESCCYLLQILPSLGHCIMERIAVDCTANLKTVNDIPRLYRRTNREVPKKASSYVTSLVKPLEMFLSEHGKFISAESRIKWSNGVVECICEQYLSVTGDVLLSVKKMEESLKRLKRGKGTASAQQGVTDDDKIRLQLYLDVQSFGEKLHALSIDTSHIQCYSSLVEVVEAAKNNA